MSKPLTINIFEEFTDIPGARYDSEGQFSGKSFLETLLLPRFKEAVGLDAKLIINLDNGEGYATSFLEEAFGGLTRIFGTEQVLKHLEFISFDEPLLIEEIKNYILEAKAAA